MIGGWIVNAVIRFSRSGTSTFASIGADISRLDRMVDGHTSRIQRMTAALEEHRRKMLQMGATATGAMSAAGFGLSAYGIYGAAELQRSLTAVQLATASNSAAAQRRYAALAFKTSAITAQDVGTIAQEMAVAASSGLNDPKKLGDAFTRIAKAADVLMMSPKHIDPIEGVRTMSQLAHLFGVYSGAPLQHMLDRATQMMFVQPEGLQQLVTQGRLFIPSARAAGVSEQDIWKQAMTMGQTSFLRGRGGSGLARVIEYLAGASSMTGHLSKLQHRALYDLGLTTSTSSNGVLRSAYLDHGKLQLQKVIDHLEAIRNNFTPTAFVGELQRAFLAQGGRYTAAILQPNVYQKSQENWQMMQKIGTVDKLWSTYSDNFLYQWRLVGTNFQNVAKATFFPVLDDLTPRLKVTGEGLGKIVAALADHPGAAKDFAYGILGLSSALGITSITMTAILGRQALLLPGAVLKMSAALDGLTAKVGSSAVAIDAESGMTAGGLGKVGSALRTLSGMTSIFLVSAGAIKGIEGLKSWYLDSKYGAGFDQKYQNYLRGLHGPYAGTSPLFGNMQPAGGGMTEDDFSAHLGAIGARKALRKAGVPASGYHGGGGFGPARSGAHTVHIHGNVSAYFPNARDREEIAAAFEEMGNPMSGIFTSVPGSRTSPVIPRQLTFG